MPTTKKTTAAVKNTAVTTKKPIKKVVKKTSVATKKPIKKPIKKTVTTTAKPLKNAPQAKPAMEILKESGTLAKDISKKSICWIKRLYSKTWYSK